MVIQYAWPRGRRAARPDSQRESMTDREQNLAEIQDEMDAADVVDYTKAVALYSYLAGGKSYREACRAAGVSPRRGHDLIAKYIRPMVVEQARAAVLPIFEQAAHAARASIERLIEIIDGKTEVPPGVMMEAIATAVKIARELGLLKVDTGQQEQELPGSVDVHLRIQQVTFSIRPDGTLEGVPRVIGIPGETLEGEIEEAG